MTQIALRSGPVTLYAQLASIMRDHILSGLWKSGEEIPTLDQLVEEYSVARVTVRQAVGMLVDDGLLSSQRGRRTYVTYEPKGGGDPTTPLVSYTGSIDSDSINYSLTVLSKQEYDELPAVLHGVGEPAGRYMRIRKVDSENGIPYVISDNYVSLPLFKRIPAGAEARIKLSRLVRDYARPPLKSGRERITVQALSYEDAHHLHAPIGSPAARVNRVFLTQDGKIALHGQMIYRADRFAVDRDISEMLMQDLPAPTKQAKRGKKDY